MRRKIYSKIFIFHSKNIYASFRMSLVTVAGYAAVLYVLAKLLTYLSKYVRSPLDVNKLGEWSLVTGATDGIGGSIIMRTSCHLF